MVCSHLTLLLNTAKHHVTVPFIYLSVALFCLLSEVLIALPAPLEALLLRHELGVKLMEDNYVLIIFLF